MKYKTRCKDTKPRAFIQGSMGLCPCFFITTENSFEKSLGEAEYSVILGSVWNVYIPLLRATLSPVFSTLKELLDTYLAMPQVDNKRIYVIGLSMGGMGTYDLAIRYPELFAAAIPICGTVNANRLKAAKDVKFRIYHGDNDNVVPVSGSRQAYKALKAAGADVEYIEFPGGTHGSWNPAFTQPDFMRWLFSQKK